MLKREITYKNFDDQEVTKEFYFNLNEAEVIEYQFCEKGASLEEMLSELSTTKDYPKIIELVKKFIKMSYGVRRGDEFVKDEDVWNSFVRTNAYSALFMELCQDSTKAAEFVNAVMPKQKSNETPETIAARA